MLSELSLAFLHIGKGGFGASSNIVSSSASLLGTGEQVINCFSPALGSQLSLEKLSIPHLAMVSAIKAIHSQEFD